MTAVSNKGIQSAKPQSTMDKTILNETTLEGLLSTGLRCLRSEDAHLLAVDANERSITYRLGLHLQRLLPNWHIDCEYNRDGHDPKTTRLQENQTSNFDTEADTVFPDIIVHRRSSKSNLLIIEVKKSSSSRPKDRDIMKLKSYLRDPLSYSYAVFVTIGVAGEADAWEWVKQ